MSEPEERPAFVFGGFDSPNTTQVPDAFFDVVAPELSEAELRVALYIIRRTFGFKKDSDTISLRQMVDGIVKKDGQILDRGTGLKKSAVTNALNGLERKGIILKQRNRSAERGNEPTTYALHVKNHPLSVPVDKGLSIHTDKPLSVPADTQYTERQHTVVQQTEYSNSFELFASMQKPSNFQNSKKRDKIEKSDALQDGVKEPVRSRRGRGFTAVAQVVASKALPISAKHAPGRPRKGSKTAAAAEDASYYHLAEIAPSSRPRGRPPKATEQIEAVVELISGEFHNEDSLPSNVGQAARLWKSSGLSEDAFVGRLYEARSITKQRGDIQKRAHGEAGEHGLRNRMPYFFAVVRDLLGMKEAQESR